MQPPVATPEPVQPAEPPEAAPAPKPTQSELYAQALKGIQEAFDAHDVKKVASFCAPECVVSSWGQPVAHGRDEVQRGLETFFETFGDARAASLRSWSKGDLVVSELAWAGTMKGDFNGIKASGKPVGQIVARVVWFDDDGLVKEMHEYADDAGLVAQMLGKRGAPPVPLLPVNTPEMHEANATGADDALVDLVRSADEKASAEGPRSTLASMSDDGDVWLNFGGAPMRGKKEIEKGLSPFWRAFPDAKWDVAGAWGIDGFAIVEHTMSGTARGPFGGYALAAKPVTGWHWLDIVQPTADGLVQHRWAFANVQEMTAQAGAPSSEKQGKVAPRAKNK